MEISVKSGDIAREPSDALITAINSSGIWSGGIDGVIQRLAGNYFHSQARAVGPLKHGQVIVAVGNEKTRAAFKNVVFVVDDLHGPLRNIVYVGLVSAAERGFTSVTLPTIRMGMMLGAVEKSLEEAVTEISEGVRRFLKEKPKSSLETITFVVYNDTTIEAALASKLRLS